MDPQTQLFDEGTFQHDDSGAGMAVIVILAQFVSIHFNIQELAVIRVGTESRAVRVLLVHPTNTIGNLHRVRNSFSGPSNSTNSSPLYVYFLPVKLSVYFSVVSSFDFLNLLIKARHFYFHHPAGTHLHSLR